jgi:hypothetical protein
MDETCFLWENLTEREYLRVLREGWKKIIKPMGVNVLDLSDTSGGFVLNTLTDLRVP